MRISPKSSKIDSAICGWQHRGILRIAKDELQAVAEGRKGSLDFSHAVSVKVC